MTVLANDGFLSVPPGKVATIVTSLEMTAKPKSEPIERPPEFEIELCRVQSPELDWYRRLYRSVGAEWLWFSRLQLDYEALAAIIHDPAVQVHVLMISGREAGILELDFRQPRESEIAFFGLTSSYVGRGVGRYLMRAAVDIAWSEPIDRLWVHTCTLDHPSALQFYRKMGFRAYRQQVEIADDPRVLGDLPRSCGAHIPIFDPA